MVEKIRGSGGCCGRDKMLKNVIDCNNFTQLYIYEWPLSCSLKLLNCIFQ